MMHSSPQKIGVLSDTHLAGLDDRFKQRAAAAFADCDTIIHAGDLTSEDILDVFSSTELYAVHGNMCTLSTRRALPESRTFTIGRFTFGLYHGDGLGHDMETGLISRFDDADCIIFGHTHRPLVSRFGSVLLVNPGSFSGTGNYGSSPTYAIITVSDSGLSAAIHTLPPGV